MKQINPIWPPLSDIGVQVMKQINPIWPPLSDIGVQRVNKWQMATILDFCVYRTPLLQILVTLEC